MSSNSGLRPMEFNVVVRLDPTAEKTNGGVYLPLAKQDRDGLAMDEGTVEAVSPHAFTYADWSDNADKPVIGDRVLFARFAGALHERSGAKFRIIKDKDIVAVVAAPLAPAVAA